MQAAQERADLASEADPSGIGQSRLGEFSPRQQAGAEERPRVLRAWVASELWDGNRQRQQGGEPWQKRHLSLEPRDNTPMARKAENPLAVHKPDGVVPAFGQQAKRLDPQHRHLGVDEPPSECIADRYLRVHLSRPVARHGVSVCESLLVSRAGPPLPPAAAVGARDEPDGRQGRATLARRSATSELSTLTT